jgi:uncharacterized damage-inducible protein DinB
MTLQEIKMLNAYNAWATNKIFQAVEALPAEETVRDMKSSHKSIHGTLTHLVGAEKMWLSRMLGTPDKSMIRPPDVPTIPDVRGTWEQTGLATAKFLGAMTDRKLQETFTMSTSTGERFTHTFAQALQHVVDHSTYHRGQVITLMRQMGYTPPNTGMISFFRETAPARKQT